MTWRRPWIEVQHTKGIIHDGRIIVTKHSSISELAPAEARTFVEGQHRLYIDGERIATAATIDVMNPATGDVLTVVPLAGAPEVDAAVGIEGGALHGRREQGSMTPWRRRGERSTDIGGSRVPSARSCCGRSVI